MRWRPGYRKRGTGPGPHRRRDPVSLAPMLDVGRLRTLLAVREHRSVSAAARALSCPATEVTEQLASLERQLGVTLVEGEPRAPRLTPAGARLAGHAERVLAELDRAEAEVATLTGRVAGRLTVGMPSCAGPALLGDTLARLRETAPEVDLRIIQLGAGPDEELGPVLAGDLAVAVVGEYGLLPRRPEPALDRRELAVEPVLVAVPGAHPVPGPTVRLAELAGERWIAGQAGGAAHEMLRRAAGIAGFEPIVVGHCDDRTALALVAAGHGVALVPATATLPATARPGTLRPGAEAGLAGVRLLTPVDPSLRHTLTAVARRSRAVDPAVRRSGRPVAARAGAAAGRRPAARAAAGGRPAAARAAAGAPGTVPRPARLARPAGPRRPAPAPPYRPGGPPGGGPATAARPAARRPAARRPAGRRPAGRRPAGRRPARCSPGWRRPVRGRPTACPPGRHRPVRRRPTPCRSSRLGPAAAARTRSAGRTAADPDRAAAARPARPVQPGRQPVRPARHPPARAAGHRRTAVDLRGAAVGVVQPPKPGGRRRRPGALGLPRRRRLAGRRPADRAAHRGHHLLRPAQAGAPGAADAWRGDRPRHPDQRAAVPGSPGGARPAGQLPGRGTPRPACRATAQRAVRTLTGAAGRRPGSGKPRSGSPNQGSPNQGSPNQGSPDQGNPNQGNQDTWPCSTAYPTNATASTRVCAITSGITRPVRWNTRPNSRPIAALPRNAPNPWYRWYPPRSSELTSSARPGRQPSWGSRVSR